MELGGAVVSGIAIGSVYALIALGFSFIYRTTGSFNFAQGQIVTFGSLISYSLYVSAGVPALAAIVIVAIAAGALGAIVERVAIWPLASRGDDTLTWLISTLGVAVLITGFAERVWGTIPLGVPNYVGPNVIHLGGQINLATPYLIGIGSVLVAAAAIEVSQRFTIWGKAMRATADNRQAVALAGVNVIRLGVVSFAIGGALAGIAGFVLAPITFADSTAGMSFAVLAFAALAIGGFASHWGAIFGGWLVGITESIGGTYAGLQYQDIFVFGVLIVILLIRPEGLTGSRNVRLV
ncbi:MAG TPA: branched-chain amino acid ABC transporter permease [Mycobacteriales bacterium]|jgi:branched-chain amino acid transport system permease protein|nr:branched-chain amino acid ABC transporter permease [Mycobacteriales bacterium]